MKINSIKNIGCFIRARLDGGKINCRRVYERIYYRCNNGDWYYSIDRHESRKELNKDNVAKLDKWEREHVQNDVSGRKED